MINREKVKGLIAYRTPSIEDIKRIKKSITKRLPRLKVNKYKKLRREKAKLTLIERLQRLYIQSQSDDTEDGIETESDFLYSNSYSETGEDADIEDNFCQSLKSKIKRKTSNSKPCEESTDDESTSFTNHLNMSPVFNDIPFYCQEIIYEENLSNLRGFDHFSPFKRESFEDKGTLADDEDCDESDIECYRKPKNCFFYTIWQEKFYD